MHLVNFSDKFQDELAALFSNKEKFKILDSKRFEKPNDSLVQKLSLVEIISNNLQPIDIEISNNITHSLKITFSHNRFYFNFDRKIIRAHLGISHFNLTILELNCRGFYSNVNNIDNELSKVFIKYKEIRSLALAFATLSGKCFLDLNKNTLQTLSLDGIKNIQRDYLINSLPNFEKLNAFSITNI